MQTYVCHKTVKAKPMSKGAYLALQNWPPVPGSDLNEAGYLVEYEPAEDNPPNHPSYQGYISWSPKGVFERGYTLQE